MKTFRVLSMLLKFLENDAEPMDKFTNNYIILMIIQDI